MEYTIYMKYDILADWTLNVYCNFSCIYCFYHGNSRLKDKKYLGHENINDIICFFDNSKFTWLVHMSGGEPFIHPKFVKMCQGLTEKHLISLNTNLSINTVSEFIVKIDPKRVAFINCSLHYDERLHKHSVDLFIDKFKNLRKADFNAFVTQVFFPPIIKDFDKIFNYFKDKSIIVRPKAFRGWYEKKQYPASYTEEEREVFDKYSQLADSIDHSDLFQIDPNLDRQFLVGDLDYKGIRCEAGRKFVYIKFNGDIVRCHAGGETLGNIFEGKLNPYQKAKICQFSICPCPYYGLKYASGKPKVIKSNYLKYLKKTFRETLLKSIRSTSI